MKKLPRTILIRWNTDNDEPYLELSENINDICIAAPAETTVGVYSLDHMTTVYATMKMED